MRTNTPSEFGVQSKCEFKITDDNNNYLRLDDNHPNSNNLHKIEQPAISGNALIDQISQFAFIHGIDPKIFTEKNNDEAWKAFNHLSLSLQPTVKRDKTQRRGALNMNQSSIPQLMG